MRHSFQSRSLFLEARLLRFAGDTEKPKPEVPPADEELANTLDEFRGMEEDGPGGLEKKVDVLEAQLTDTVKDCKDMLARMRDKPGKLWQDMADRFQESMSKAFAGSALPAEKIQNLAAILQEADGEIAALEQGLKPSETLNDMQRQQFVSISAEARSMVEAIRSGDTEKADMQLRIVNESLGGVDPVVRDALFKQYMVRREGTVVKAKDGSRYSFTVTADDTLQYELLAPAAKNEVNETEKADDAPQQTTEEMLADLQARLPDFLARVGIDKEGIAKLMPKLMGVIEKHAETIRDAGDFVFTPEMMNRMTKDGSIEGAIAEIQNIGAENGWSAELTEGMCTFFNDFVDAFMSALSGDEKNDNDAPVAPIEKSEEGVPSAVQKPKDIAGSAESAVDRLRDGMNKPKEMTEKEKTSIIDAGKKILEEYKKIDKPTKAQSEQARGQLMMAGVDATAGVDALAKNPEGVKAKEGTEFQVTMNKVMGFVIYVMSIVQEMKDTVKGAENEKKDGEKKGDEKKEGVERTKETARAEVDGHVEELKKFNESDEFSASGNGAETLKKLNESTASYVRDFGGEADITQSVMDAAGTLFDVDSNAFVNVAYDPVEKAYSFVPVEDRPEAQPEPPAEEKEGPEEEAPQPPAEEREPEEQPEPPAEEEEEQPEAETDSYENLQQQSTDLQSQLDALDDKKAEDLTDEELDQVKQLRKERAAIDAKIAEIEAGR